MNIVEITRPSEIDDADTILRQAGYEDLQHSAGHTSGTFARVFTKPGSNYVLKLFAMEDYAYRRYLNLITSVQNPHFPVIRGKPIRVSNIYYAVRLERLTPFNMALSDTRKAMDRYLKTLQDYDEAQYNRKSHKFPAIQQELDMYLSKLNPITKEALDLIYQYCIKGHPGTIVDLHVYNVMMRGNDIVIIDPIAYGRATETTPRHPTFQKFPAYMNNLPVPMPNQIGAK